MNKYLKKLRHLQHTMIHWAEENKIRKNKGKFQIPNRKDDMEWKDDFKYVNKLEMDLNDDMPHPSRLNNDEMKMCNELYRFYSQVYIPKRTFIKDMLKK